MASNFGRECADRREVVENVDAASVRRQKQIRLARLDRDVAHGHVGQVAFELRPVRAAIDGDKESELGPDK